MTIFEAIKNRSLNDLKAVAGKSNLNEQDKYGRTPLHYAIVQKAPIEFFSELINLGADVYIEDKLQDTVLDKAIKFKNIEAINILLEMGFELNHPNGIFYTPWYRARHNPSLADLLIKTKGAFRLTLSDTEKEIVDDLLYSDIDEVIKKIDKLNTIELTHAYVSHFNWDDDIEPMMILIDRTYCSIVTAKEMFDLADGEYWLENHDVDEFGQKYKDLINKILLRFPEINEY